MQFHQTPHEGQAKAKAPLRRVDTVIRLHEEVEDPREHVWADADPGIPHPEDRVGPFLVIVSSIRPPDGVYFTALSKRFETTCCSRVGSPFTMSDPPARAISCWAVFPASVERGEHPHGQASEIHGSLSSTILPVTIFETSNRSSTNRERCCVCRLMIPRNRAAVVRLAEPVEDLNGRADRAEWVPQLMPEHREELVLGAIRAFGLASSCKGQDLLVLAPQTLTHPQQDFQPDVRVSVHEAAKLLALDFEDDTGVADPDGGGTRLALEEGHLPEGSPLRMSDSRMD